MINKSHFLSLILFTISIINLSGQACLPDGIEFFNQAQVDSFRANYPDCSIILGNLVIDYTPITNLDSLIGITEIQGKLYLESNDFLPNLNGLNNLSTIGGGMIIEDNPILANLNGLNSLFEVGDRVYFEGNRNLISLNGLENIEFINGNLSVEEHLHLKNLDGLESLKSINGKLTISENSELLNIDGLSALESINGELMIDANYDLTQIEGLSSLKSINGRLVVVANPQLTSLEGLHNIAPNSITDLFLSGCSSLSFCSIQSICDFLTLDIGPHAIGNNIVGCNNEPQITDNCNSTTSVQMINENFISLFPNPILDRFQINHNLELLESISILNMSGQECFKLDKTKSDFDVSNLVAGIYNLKVNTANEVLFFKFIKL